jgi:hypothetical protein
MQWASGLVPLADSFWVDAAKVCLTHSKLRPNRVEPQRREDTGKLWLSFEALSRRRAAGRQAVPEARPIFTKPIHHGWHGSTRIIRADSRALAGQSLSSFVFFACFVVQPNASGWGYAAGFIRG